MNRDPRQQKVIRERTCPAVRSQYGVSSFRERVGRPFKVSKAIIAEYQDSPAHSASLLLAATESLARMHSVLFSASE